jgi:NAD-dependent deacetylase sirtuin 4
MSDAETLAAHLRGRRVLVLTGAGCSTESGIPDYRGPGSRPRSPVMYQDFVRDAEARQRYWARSTLGWPRFRAAGPNAAHVALASLEAAGHLAGLLTQNVDGLHHAAGHQHVVELHGALAWVVCLGCRALFDRDAVQADLLAANPDWEAEGTDAPDGDVDVDPAAVSGFVVPDCPRCGGLLKPDVVFFGENVPAPRVAEAWARLDAADVLLVIGSSLTVFSGYRFARRAAEQGKPVLVVNQGETRADAIATLKVEARAGVFLPALVALLRSPGEARAEPTAAQRLEEALHDQGEQRGGDGAA